MTKRLAAFALVLGVMTLAARPATAQSAGATTSDPALQQQTAPATTPAATTATTPAPTNGADNAVARFGPTAEGAKLLKPAATQEDHSRVAHEPAYRHSAPGVALMIVGGALFLGGAIVAGQAGDALMVAGVVVAAVGLYQYLQ